MITVVREELGQNQMLFSRRHPLSCWISSIVVCFAGSFLANFLLGEPIIAPLKKHDDIILVTFQSTYVLYSLGYCRLVSNLLLAVRSFLQVYEAFPCQDHPFDSERSSENLQNPPRRCLCGKALSQRLYHPRFGRDCKGSRIRYNSHLRAGIYLPF